MADLIIGPFLVFAVMLLALMLLLRPFVIWYFKIGRAVEALESIAESLEQMPAAKEYRTRVRQAGRKVA
jgi:hypothetical protein